MGTVDAIESTQAPLDRPVDYLDVRDLPPPEPLTETLTRLASLDDEYVLLQANDRVPQHLLPKLEDRGYTYESVTVDGVVHTAIWQTA